MIVQNCCFNHHAWYFKPFNAGERGVAFSALSDMATSLAALGFGPGFEACLPAIAAQIQVRAALILRRKQCCTRADLYAMVACCGASATGR